MLWSASSQHAPLGSSESMFPFIRPVSGSIVLSNNKPEYYNTTAWKIDLHESNHWISHLKAQIRDDGRETICSQQWHHQLFQTLAHLVLLREEKRLQSQKNETHFLQSHSRKRLSIELYLHEKPEKVQQLLYKWMFFDRSSTLQYSQQEVHQHILH